MPINSDVIFSESFSKVKIRTEKEVIIGDESYDILMLTCEDMRLRNEFAAVCSQFVQPGVDGNLRKGLINSPDIWWSQWKNLLGNMESDKLSYPVLGELVCLEKLLQKNLKPLWSGADGATHDIELDDCSYEVKSTTNRYGYEITINSVYQLTKSNETLYLIFCRFERSLSGRSVDDVAESIKSLGYSAEKLETILKKSGLEKGCTARNLKYKLLEMKKYNVNEKFPFITEHSFKNDTLPGHIIKFSYTVDLSGIENENLI